MRLDVGWARRRYLPFDHAEIGRGEFEGEVVSAAETKTIWEVSGALFASRLAAKGESAVKLTLDKTEPNQKARHLMRQQQCAAAN